MYYVQFFPLHLVLENLSAEEERVMAMRMRCFSSTKMALWFLILLPFAVQIRGQPTGSIFIDCGIPENSSYLQGMTYVSDYQYIDTGVNYNVLPKYVSDLARRYLTVRSFPEGVRNCYNFKSMTPGLYLIRATFLYGNYDSKNSSSVQFDLYAGVNLWKTINLTDPSNNLLTETVTEATADVISVCLVNTGLGTPFISGLDLRPVPGSLYPLVNASRSLVLLDRVNMAPTGATFIRYPLDSYDRYWYASENEASWNGMSTNSTIQNFNDQFDPVPEVMQTAVYPVNSNKLEYSLTPEAGDLNEFYAVMYFSELQQNASRQFFIYLNGALLNDAKPFTPDYLYSDTIYNTSPSAGYSKCNISLVATTSSTLPPILNAIEVFTAMRNTNMASDSGDVDAMVTIKVKYQVKKNWMGDPCSPEAYMWNGLNCTSNPSGIPRITAVNLSYSELVGGITTAFANLAAIQYLDLSQNNLTGSIPAALGYLTSLKVLDLRNNQLNGSVPSALLAKSQNGSITLRIDPSICADATSCDSKPTTRQKGKIAIIVISCVVAVVLLFVVVIIICMPKSFFLKKGKKQVKDATEKVQSEGKFQLENKKFTYMELVNITNNFERTIGKGGFGTVYHGHLEDGTEVAVKMLSQSSQATKDFLAEAQHLTRVHHKGLVSMVGYCMDGDHLALVCEFMSQGTLKEHLKGTHTATPLSWEQRLKIALEAAQGLEYLHTGCRPPLIHRDVKTANILLNEKLEAKISDFGMSRTFQNDGHSHTSTRVVGTVGYLDPEYIIKNQLSQKSDVYSFGVVLLELITGQPPVIHDLENIHIVEWVRQRLAEANIENVVDSSLQQEHIVNSAWKIANVALACAAHASNKRPTMTDVVVQLKESLALYSASDDTQFQHLSSGKLYTESGDPSRINAVDIEEAGCISDSEGPSAR